MPTPDIERKKLALTTSAQTAYILPAGIVPLVVAYARKNCPILPVHLFTCV